MIADMQSPEFRNYMKNLSSDRYGVDLKQRKQEKQDDPPVASFRKLNVDWWQKLEIDLFHNQLSQKRMSNQIFLTLHMFIRLLALKECLTFIWEDLYRHLKACNDRSAVKVLGKNTVHCKYACRPMLIVNIHYGQIISVCFIYKRTALLGSVTIIKT